MPRSTTAEVLTGIWERVLDRCPIRAEENFFDLGGNDRAADRLFAEIARVFGRQLPSATIGYAPTVSALADILQQPNLPTLSPFIQMKSGSEKPPIFMVHGLGGGTAELYGVVKRIQTKHAIYGIQAKGIDGLQPPLERVEDMASFYLAALEEVEPRGPYILIGYSFGGLVALEMAQQLSANRKQVGLLVLLDTYPDEHSLARVQRLRLIAQRVKFHINGMLRMPLSGAVQYFLRKLKARRRFSAAPSAAADDRETLGLSFAQTSFRVERQAYFSFAKYRPRFYPGKIKFVATADTKSFFLPPDPVAIWKEFVGEFEPEMLPGDHSEMANAQCEGLASVLTRYILEATS